MKHPKANQMLVQASLITASALMLTVIQVPVSIFFSAWVAYVPFVLASSPHSRKLPLFIAAYVISLVYWLGNLYWLVPVTIPGWLTFCAYTALLWPLLTLAIRFCRTKNIPLTIAVPVLIVGAEQLQGFLLGGFFWRHLSHSQFQNIPLIQIADIFGAAGVSFLVAMVNGLFAEWIIAVKEKQLIKKALIVKNLTVAAVLAASVLYGRWRINQSADALEAGPLVASVQTNVPQSVKESSLEFEKTFNEMLTYSDQSMKAGAELVVWPETMVTAHLDPVLLLALESDHNYRYLDQTIREAARNKAYILVGAYGAKFDELNLEIAERYNSAFLYTPEGIQAGSYNKIHLVPFGEVVPFKKSIPWLYDLLMTFTPYDYDYSLNYGTQYTIFNMKSTTNRNLRDYKFGVMICYEDAVPYIARKFVLDKNGKKRIHWLVNISNDGWFVRYDGKNITPSAELSQHAAVCVFRAVENRLPIIRSVNTGISCIIDSFGRINNGFLAGNLPKKALERTACQGWFVDRVHIDKRTTFFSRTGQWLGGTCSICLVVLVIGAFKKPRTVQTKHRNEKNKK